MNPVPVFGELAARHPGFRRIVVAGPNGDLTNDGSSPEKALAVEALVGVIDGWPAFIVHMRLEPDEIAQLDDDGLLRVTFYVPQMPVHSIGVVPGTSPAKGGGG